MRRTLVTASLVLLALGGGVASASTVALDKVVLAAKTTTCTTGQDDGSRAATFTGSMPAVTGTRRMQMRFVLVQRLGAGSTGAFKRVDVPGWGGWEKSDPGRPGYVFTKRVEALAAPASYRAQISFRWIDAKGHTLRTVTKTSPTCIQPDPRPDLTLDGLDIAAQGSGQAAYALAVSNDGHSAAAPFLVTITVDGTVLPPLTLGPLDVGERGQGTIVGPRCSAGSMVTVTVDSQGAVDESDEAGDTVRRPCQIG